jgi:hypothetical protein
LTSIFIGLDPGVTGGIAFQQMPGVVSAVKMPETDRDLFDLLHSYGIHSGAHAMLERVSCSPQMGVKSVWTFACGYGRLRMALTAAGIPYDEVSPLRWQNALGCRSKGDKNVTKARAQALFPDIKVTHAIADAILLSEYCRRVRTGTLAAPPQPKAKKKVKQRELF